MNAKRVTSQDVANLAGVSRTTVSFVLNNVVDAKISQATREKVLEAAKQLGYVPDAAAQALASRRAQIVGLILSRSPHHIASDAFLTQFIIGLLEVIHQHDLRLLIDFIEPEHQVEAYLRLVRAKRIDGILLTGPRLDDQALRVLEEDGFPTVLIGQLPGTSFCSVDVDNCSAARKAVEHLISLGHKDIACITNAPISYTSAVDRLRGYRQALENAGLPYRDALVCYGDYDVDSGYKCMKALLDNKVPVTAVFVASDTVALGANAAINQSGLKIPEDIALVGFDDLPFAQYIEPAMTTVHLPVADLARKASKMLIGLLNVQEADCRSIILDTHLVVRKSCGAYLN